MDGVRQLAGLTADPQTSTTWASSLFTCTYALPEGHLVLSVKESTDPATARAYFDGLQAAAPKSVVLQGFDGLGLPAFTSPAGTAAFVRDSMTLLVDASGLPATVGPQKTERTSFAYAVATNVLACWKEHSGS